MKKILLMALFAIVAVGASAQKNFTVWYGANIANLNADGSKSEFKPLNFGVAYTAPLADAFDWSAGLGYVTKGAKEWDPGFIQLEANAGWNFVSSDEAKVGLFTGPALGFMVAKDDMDDEAKTFHFGWQAGAKASWKFLSFKVGYEYGFCKITDYDDSKPYEVFFRVGYNF